MPRDVNGTYTLPGGNPVITLENISSTWANNTLSDIATALTNSLSIDGSVTTAKLANSAVTTAKIADANVTTAKIADANVTTAKIADGAITSAKIADGTIATADLADGAVTSAKIADGTIVAADLASDSVTTAKILDANVTTAKIADSAITSAKIADGTIVSADLANDSVITAKILDANVTTAKIADSNVTTAKIADGAVTSAKIADGTIVAADLANDSVTTAKILDSNVTRAKLSSSLRVGAVNKNWLINGAMLIRQVTLGGASTGYDKFFDTMFLNSTGTTRVGSSQTWPVGQTDVDPAAKEFGRVVVSSVAGAGNFCRIELPLESVSTLNGKTCTFSFWAKADATKNIAIGITQNFGQGGSPSGSVDTYAGQVTLSTSWARYSVTVNVPSISGKTIGTNGPPRDYLGIYVWMDAGTNFNSRTGSLGQQSGTFDFWGFKMEEGSEASTFEVPDPTETLMKCYRYYYNSSYGVPGGVGVAFGGAFSFSGEVVNGNNYRVTALFPVPLYRLPSPAQVSTDVSNMNDFGMTEVQTTNKHVQLQITANATGVGRFDASVRVNASIIPNS